MSMSSLDLADPKLAVRASLTKTGPSESGRE
jgi:hypothetical protein